MLIKTQDLKEAVTNTSLSTVKDKDSTLHNIVIKLKNGKMTIVAQSNTTRIKQKLDTQSKEEFSALINPQKLLNILKEIRNENIELKKEKDILTIKSDNFISKIKTLNPQLFPEPKDKENIRLICTMDAEKLKKLIRETIYCPDKNDIAREYTGIYFELNKENIKATATDHYRLINIKTDLEGGEEINFIIENSGANLINRIPLSGELKIYTDGDEILIREKDIEISSKLIKGTFPDYNQILLDRETSNAIEINREIFKDAVKKSSVLSENREITVKIELENRSITLISQNQEGETAEDKLTFNNIGSKNDLIIKLDSKFILDFLGQISSEKAIFIYRTSEEPVMFEAEEESYSYKYIMTPIIEW